MLSAWKKWLKIQQEWTTFFSKSLPYNCTSICVCLLCARFELAASYSSCHWFFLRFVVAVVSLMNAFGELAIFCFLFWFYFALMIVFGALVKQAEAKNANKDLWWSHCETIGIKWERKRKMKDDGGHGLTQFSYEFILNVNCDVHHIIRAHTNTHKGKLTRWWQIQRARYGIILNKMSAFGICTAWRWNCV